MDLYDYGAALFAMLPPKYAVRVDPSSDCLYVYRSMFATEPCAMVTRELLEDAAAGWEEVLRHVVDHLIDK